MAGLGIWRSKSAYILEYVYMHAISICSWEHKFMVERYLSTDSRRSYSFLRNQQAKGRECV